MKDHLAATAQSQRKFQLVRIPAESHAALHERVVVHCAFLHRSFEHVEAAVAVPANTFDIRFLEPQLRKSIYGFRMVRFHLRTIVSAGFSAPSTSESSFEFYLECKGNPGIGAVEIGECAGAVVSGAFHG